jgi:AraC-like DNA-binding protein
LIRFEVVLDRVFDHPPTMQTGLPTFPVPAFAALFLAVLAAVAAARSVARGEEGARWWLPALILACALQAGIVAMVQHYGLLSLRRVQPVTACAIPPLAWLAFLRTAADLRDPRRAWPHLLVPGAAASLAAVGPFLLDAMLPATFAAYGAAILWRLRAGADAAPVMRLGAGERPIWLWRLIGASLIGSAVSDVLIAATLAAGRPEIGGWIITFGSTITLTLVGWVAVAGDLRRAGAPSEPAVAPAITPPSEDDAALVARLDALFAQSGLHLDPDLSLTRLARRLGVPAKRLSAAVNRVTGGNVSRHVNARRVAAACARLRAGDSVTAAWLASGFATRSNFNREFRRVTGTTPNAYARDEA